MGISKLLFMVTLSFLFAFNVNAAEEACFRGSWDHYYYDSSNELCANFSLDLEQEGEMVTGSHSGVFYNGRYLEDNDNSVTGYVNNGIAYISIVSDRTANIPGNAIIRHIGTDSIEFMLTKEPSGGESI